MPSRNFMKGLGKSGLAGAAFAIGAAIGDWLVGEALRALNIKDKPEAPKDTDRGSEPPKDPEKK